MRLEAEWTCGNRCNPARNDKDVAKTLDLEALYCANASSSLSLDPGSQLSHIPEGAAFMCRDIREATMPSCEEGLELGR